MTGASAPLRQWLRGGRRLPELWGCKAAGAICVPENESLMACSGARILLGAAAPTVTSSSHARLRWRQAAGASCPYFNARANNAFVLRLNT